MVNSTLKRELIDFFEEGLVLTTADGKNLNVKQEMQGFRVVNYLDVNGKQLSYTIGKSFGEKRDDENKSRFLESTHVDEEPLSDTKTITGDVHPLNIFRKSSGQRILQRHKPRFLVSSMMVGTSKAMLLLREQLTNIAMSNSTVLLTGETGTGKDLAARFIHENSLRWDKPFENINCAAIPDTLFESEVFGYSTGAFTGASSKGKAGKFVTANGGTVLLDEISRLSIMSQGKILHVIENKLIQRLGEERTHKIDTRIIAATNTNLTQAIAENKFLPDLYYRLNVIPISVPPLRERIEDIPLLLDFFVNLFRKDLQKSDFYGFSDEVIDLFMNYHWPGNVRELKNTVEYLITMVHGRKAILSDIPFHFEMLLQKSLHAGQSRASITALDEMEMLQIQLALEAFGKTSGGKLLAARHLGISLSTLYRKMSRAGLNHGVSRSR